METLSKPNYCGQDWSNMKPIKGGRLCGHCNKTIVDFSKMTWVEIEKIQQENNNSVCGMYSQKQLDNWGYEIPPKKVNKIAATVALSLSMLTVATQARGQTLSPVHKDSVQKRTIIYGRVTGKTEGGNIDTLPFTSIHLKGARTGIWSDKTGQYKLDITDYIDTITNPTIIYDFPGFAEFEKKLDNKIRGNINFDPQLKANGRSTTFYVTAHKKNLWQRIKWKIGRWFR